jgi:hypothetical protein
MVRILLCVCKFVDNDVSVQRDNLSLHTLLGSKHKSLFKESETKFFCKV